MEYDYVKTSTLSGPIVNGSPYESFRIVIQENGSWEKTTLYVAL